MAKKKESIFKNWDEVDAAIKKLGELEIKKTKLEGEQTIKTNEIIAAYKNRCVGIANEIKETKTEIERFCAQNKDAFIDKRNKKLSFGTVSYRITEKVKIFSIPTAIKALKALNCDFCLRIKEEIDKDEVKKLNPSTLTKIGVTVEKKDSLCIEPNMIKIAAEN